MDKSLTQRLSLIPLLALPAVLTYCFSWLFHSYQWPQFYTGYTLACLLTFALLLFILRQGKMRLSDIGFRDFRWSHIGWGLLFFGIACVWCTGVALILKYGFGLSKDWLLRIRFSQPFHPALMLVAVVLVGPVTEESLFRGFFLTVLRGRLRFWLAGLISALLFGFYYYWLTGLTGALLILFWSPLPFILFVRNKSIYPGIILHMVNNLFPYVIIKMLGSLALVQTLTHIGLL